MLHAQTIHNRLVDRFGAGVESFGVEAQDSYSVIQASCWREVAQFMRDDPELAFDVLIMVTGVDYPAQKRIACVYHLLSYAQRHRATIKVWTPRDAPWVPSIESIWPAANWHERECYEMLGVVFEGHSDFRRILMPEDWEGHPLRKDYVSPEFYHGIRNT